MAYTGKYKLDEGCCCDEQKQQEDEKLEDLSTAKSILQKYTN